MKSDERRPVGGGVSVDAGSTDTPSVRREDVMARQRRQRREQEFSADVAEFLAGLDRRRRAELRIQPLADPVDGVIR